MGPKTVTFTGANCGGIFTATQTIDITACRSPMAGLDLSGPVLGGPGKSYTFTASALPLDLTGPVTYTWQATGKPPTQIVALTESAKTLCLDGGRDRPQGHHGDGGELRRRPHGHPLAGRSPARPTCRS